ncbi:MAG: ATP-binding protein, partial [Dehalococcoidia bacterium]
LLNLFANASDAMQDGGEIAVSTKIDEECAVLTLSDTGEGIPEEVKEKIFESLYTTKMNGTGLGLTVTKSIIEEHGGTIEVESVENQGTTFTIRLPRV